MTGHKKCKCGRWISDNRMMCYPCIRKQQYITGEEE